MCVSIHLATAKSIPLTLGLIGKDDGWFEHCVIVAGLLVIRECSVSWVEPNLQMTL